MTHGNMESATVEAITPRFHVVRYGPGESVQVSAQLALVETAAKPRAQRGDFILTHSTGWYVF
jgi:hypothetical protein